MDIRPFGGWRYAAGSDVSNLVAPPYDILTQHDKDALLAGDPRNIVGVDMPHVPPKELGPESEYVAAAETLAAWKADGTLRQDDPCLYVYEQTYTWAGRAYTRRGLLAGVRATPFGQDVIPHEHTFAGPKADRLRLTQLTHMQLSPIFGFYNDRDGKVSAILDEQASREPDTQGVLRGVQEKLWAITDGKAMAAIAAALKSVPVYIADGHHRYTTAMNYRDALKADGLINEEHPANFVMFSLVARTDPGLLVLPTHRLVRGLKKDCTIEKLLERLQKNFEVRRLEAVPDSLADMDGVLAPFGVAAMGLLTPEGFWVLKVRSDQPMADAAPDQPEPWRKLDVAILHTLILDQALEGLCGEDFEVSYTPDGEQARSAVASSFAQMAFCLQGTPLAAVEAVADAGASMPHKSTYFYPKIATGMVLKPVE